MLDSEEMCPYLAYTLSFKGQTMPWLYPAALGWLLGLITALLGALLNDRLTTARETARDQRVRVTRRAHFAWAIAAELEGLFRRYMSAIGEHLEQAKSATDLQS